MTMLSKVGLGLGTAVVVGVVDGGVARVLMRGVALATGEPPAFSMEATLGIMLVFAITAVPLAVTSRLTLRRGVRLTSGIVGTLLLAFFAVNIGLQEVANADGLGGWQWVALSACVAGLAAVVVLQSWVVLGLLRLGRARSAVA
jgi:hypothetical protein